MSYRYLFVPVQGDQKDLGILTKPPSLEDLQRYVGGYIEYVPEFYHSPDGGWAVIANGDGHILNLTPNIKAMTMVGWKAPIPLVGDVVLCRKVKSYDPRKHA